MNIIDMDSKEVAQLLNIRRQLIDQSDKASKALVEYCKPFKGSMGLVSDECRKSTTYIHLKNIYELSKKALQVFNQGTRHNKEFQKAIKEEIMQRRTKGIKEY